MTTSSRLLGGLNHEDWLSLSFLSGIGPARLSRLFTYFDQLDRMQETDLLSETDAQPFPDQVNYELLRHLKWPDVTAREAMTYLDHQTLSSEQAEKKRLSLDWLADDYHHLLLQSDPLYPNELKEISVAPAFLYVDGALASFALPKLGIVGARHCTGYGREITRQLASQLARQGISVVSGGARGIDTAAHQGALEAAITPTIAVMGTGLFMHYPKQNKGLFQEILAQGGCLVSEYPLMTEVRPHLFPPRNRIISGLSMGVLVTEASPKSGSLISANYAVQQNREVFALPGRVKDAQAEGCHQLIRQGAILVRHAEDILDEILPASRLQNGETTGTKVMKSTEKKSIKGGNNRRIVSRETLLKQAAGQTKRQLTEDAANTKDTAFSLIEINPKKALPAHLSDNARTVAALLETESQAMDFDALVRHTQLAAPSMMQVLMELELCQCIENRHGVYVRC
ncbi:DNA-processing protein DprA [Marinomonas sp. NPDC078689]|uniref:DNA-processing protein DprA n=1 Tax=Marinomonas sp. NPDC078689 TaxID=3364147 RepID=UPI0037C93B16